MKKQCAIIGVTGFGLHHFDQLLRLADAGLAEVAAAVIRTPAKAAAQLEELQKRHTRIYATAEELFASEAGRIDLVCIPVGIDAHETLTVSALKAGMNVLLEKPAAGSVAAVERMIAAEKAAAGKFVAVAFQHAYAPEIHFFKRLLLSRRFGGIRRSGVLVCWPRDDEYYRRNSWAAKRSVRGVPVLDSPLNNACAHYLNLLLFLHGATPYRCAAATGVAGTVLRARPDIEMFDACDVDFTLSDGAKTRILLAHCCRENFTPRLRIVCDGATFTWNNNSSWDVTANDGTVVASGTAIHPGAAMFRLALDRIDDPATPVYTLENALEHTRCIEMLDRTLPITPAEAEYREGFYAVPGLEARLAAKFAEV